MNIASMFLRILAILGALAAAAMFWVIGDTKDKLEADLQNTETRLSQTEGQLSDVQQERDEFETQIAQLGEELEDTRANATQLRSQLTQVRRELEQAKQAATAQEREAENLRAEAAQIRRQLLDERTRVSQLEENVEDEDAADLRASIKALEQQLLDTEQKLQSVATTEGEEATPADRPREPARPIIRGQVSEVGEDSKFILLDMGEEQGIRHNTSVMIRRGPRYIGRAVVADVRENTSIAEVQPGASNVRPGDSAVTLN